MTIHDRAVEMTTGTVYQAHWGWISPEEATKQILETLNPVIWPRCTPGYGTTGTRRNRLRARAVAERGEG